MSDQERGPKIVLQSGLARPGAVYSTLLKQARPDLSAVRIAVAYATLAGSSMLFDEFHNQLLLGWNRVGKQLVTSFDYGLTEPAALTYLQDAHNMDVRIANVEVINRRLLIPNRAFHAKAYFFDYNGDKPRTELVSGSANLTQRALTVNDELVTVSVHDPADDNLDDAWSLLFDDAVELTPALLDEYRSVRDKLRPQVPLEEPVEAPQLTPITHSVFWDAVLAGYITPLEAPRFWIEAGSMSSGGSNNQLELPRGANRFFGVSFDDYTDANESMGSVHLVVRGRHYVRDLKWHGNNRMERIYLPTVQQGGYSYAGKVVQFVYTGDGFIVEVVPRDSAVASGWISASRERGLIFRVGANSDRLCGLL